MILKRLLSPLPHPSSHLPYGAASCPLFIFAVGFEWQGDKQGWWRVLFAAVGLIDRWGVGGVLRSARCVTPFKLDEKQYVNFTHTIPVRLWPTAEMTLWIPEAVWPLVMKSLLFLCCWCWPLRAGNNGVLWFALTFVTTPADSQFSMTVLEHNALFSCLFYLYSEHLQPVTDSVTDCNTKPIISSALDNVSNIVHLSGWANGRCNISHALHGIFDTTTIVSCYQYRAQYTWYL